MDKTACPVCASEAEQSRHPTRDADNVTCQRCGKFVISRTLHTTLQNKDYSCRQRVIASSLLHQVNDKGFILTTDNYTRFFESSDLTMLEKSDTLLLWVESKTSGPDGFNDKILIDFNYPKLQCVCWAIDSNEIKALYKLLVDRGFLLKFMNGSSCSITAKGWERLESLRTPNTDSSQGFVAMWFAPQLLPLYIETIGPAIADAGYKPHRVDQREYAGRIDDEIIRQIRASRFVVADATGDNSGAYYEAGFAHGLGLPVFWTCKKEPDQKLHFDVRQHNCIFWEDDKLDEFRGTLARRIEAELGRGPVVTS